MRNRNLRWKRQKKAITSLLLVSVVQGRLSYWGTGIVCPLQPLTERKNNDNDQEVIQSEPSHALAQSLPERPNQWITTRAKPSPNSPKIICWCWRLTSQSTLFQLPLPGFYQYFGVSKMWVSHGHSTDEVGIVPQTIRSWVTDSTNSSLCHHQNLPKHNHNVKVR